jgi:hypothetical protein
MVIVRTSRLSHPTVSCRRADRPRAGPTGNCWVLPDPVGAAATSEEVPRTWSRSGPASSGAPPPGRRSARTKARRRSAACRHSGEGCTDAPLPGSRRRGSGTRAPDRATTRNRSLTGARFRHPTQVRTGIDVSATLHSSAWRGLDVPRVWVEACVRACARVDDLQRSRPAGPTATAPDPPPETGSRPRRRPAHRCGCRSGTR